MKLVLLDELFVILQMYETDARERGLWLQKQASVKTRITRYESYTYLATKIYLAWDDYIGCVLRDILSSSLQRVSSFLRKKYCSTQVGDG